MNIVERPDQEYVVRMFTEGYNMTNPRNRALHNREVYDFMCKHYEQYIESLSARIDELETQGTILAEIVAVKKSIAKLSETIIERGAK